MAGQAGTGLVKYVLCTFVVVLYQPFTIQVQGDQCANPPMGPTHVDTDDWLWNNFVTDFKQMFMDTASVEYAELMKPKMKGDDIDKYIAALGHLII